MYTKKRTTETRIRWECSKRKALTCYGAVTTDLEMKQVICSAQHTHDPDHTKVEAAKVKAALKETAVVNRGRPGQIVADVLVEQPVNVRAAVGQLDSIKRTIRRHQKGALPKDPASLSQLKLEGEWQTTGAPDYHEFLIHDSGDEIQSRVIVFASEQTLQHLVTLYCFYLNECAVIQELNVFL